eukprot:TRINITY_DN18119_c0_g1_i7.p1 TRINITY_DN18119_c0_g1~~TRINITY_DN18119_c0_g1_i7.p1  ORF type:complete len:130 (+),score=18.97 TRINITY_DN18119_c0_g1_i7:266-655(+)
MAQWIPKQRILGVLLQMGICAAGLVDTQKPPELILGNMTAAMCVYPGLFMGLDGWFNHLIFCFLLAMPLMKQCNSISSHVGGRLKGKYMFMATIVQCLKSRSIAICLGNSPHPKEDRIKCFPNYPQQFA